MFPIASPSVYSSRPGPERSPNIIEKAYSPLGKVPYRSKKLIGQKGLKPAPAFSTNETKPIDLEASDDDDSLKEVLSVKGRDFANGDEEKQDPPSWLEAPRNSKRVLSFAPHDPDNPHNWSLGKKLFLLLIAANGANNANIGSTLASSTWVEVREFGVQNNIVLVLPATLYLLGYVTGPLVTAPLSEYYGRKVPLLASMSLFCIWTLACALAPNMPALIIFRYLQGFGASTPVSVMGGIAADLYPDPIPRGLALGFVISAAGFGQAIGAILSGYLAFDSRSLPYWAALVILLVSLLINAIMPETLAPVVLRNKAKKMRRASGEEVYAPMELGRKKSLSTIFAQQLKVPARMLVTEPLVFLTCLYMMAVYSLYYAFFQAYHRVYEEGYHMSPGSAGLTFIAAGLGGWIAFGIQWWYDKRSEKREESGEVKGNIADMRRLPLACLAGPMFFISLMWTGASASRPATAPWIVPVLAMVFFGCAYNLMFISLSNYLVDSYEIYAASALAAASASRSLAAAFLPLACKSLYDNLGVEWGFYTLGFLMLGLATIPFIFIRFGPSIRERSRFFQELKRKKEDDEKSLKT